MTKHKLTRASLKKAINVHKGNIQLVADNFDIPHSTMRRWVKKLDLQDHLDAVRESVIEKPDPILVAVEQEKEKSESAALKEELKLLKQSVAEDKAISEVVNLLKPVNQVPTWKTPKGKRDKATACVMLSDLHYGEVVNPHEIQGVNAYNMTIAEQRTKECFSNVIKLARDHIGGVDYQGCQVFLGGDIVSGRIHEELRRSNETDSVFEQAEFAIKVLGAGIKQLAEHFGNVHVSCVVGNHGRVDRERTFKGYVKDSFDRMVYSRLRELCTECTWQIPESRDCLVAVNETKYLLTHGDQFRGGSGISGIITPLKTGAYRKRRNIDFDHMVIGHFHQYMDIGDVIVNGSLKGWDEFSAGFNFPIEEPRQAFWLDQPGYGKTISAPIHCRSGGEDWAVFRESA